MNPLVTPQPPPHQSNGVCIADLVIKDMQDRKQFGIDKYGAYLEPTNGRNMLVDTYQELMDACVYMRGEIESNWVEPYDLW